MSLKDFTDGALITKLKNLVAEERKATTEILHFLREVESRRLDAVLGFPSLFEFCTKELGYSAGAAQRRIESMRLLKSLGEAASKKIEESIQGGKVNLTQLSLLQAFVRNKEKKEHQKIKPEEKLTWLNQMASRPTRECEKILQAIDPNTPLFPKEKERVMGDGRTELKFCVSETLLSKLNRIRELRVHVNPKMTYEELLEYLAEVALEKNDPERRAKRIHEKTEAKRHGIVQEQILKELPETAQDTKDPAHHKCSSGNSLPAPEVKTPRAIPAHIKRKVWLRDGGRCTYQSPETGKVCGSQFGLEFKHRHPFALGGQHTEANVTLDCKAHNLVQAFKQFGENKMKFYIK